MVAIRYAALAMIAPAAAFLPVAPGSLAPQHTLLVRHSANVHGSGLVASVAPAAAMSKSRMHGPQRLGLRSLQATGTVSAVAV